MSLTGRALYAIGVVWGNLLELRVLESRVLLSHDATKSLDVGEATPLTKGSFYALLGTIYQLTNPQPRTVHTTWRLLIALASYSAWGLEVRQGQLTQLASLQRILIAWIRIEDWISTISTSRASSLARTSGNIPNSCDGGVKALQECPFSGNCQLCRDWARVRSLSDGKVR